MGFLFMFVPSIFQTIQITFSKLLFSSGKMDMKFIGLENYNHILFKDPNYLRNLTESIQYLALHVPVIIIFSLFIAIILNQKFKGRMVMRSIFFLPVIIASGVVLSIIRDNPIWSDTNVSGVTSRLMNSIGLMQIMINIGIPPSVIEFLFSVIAGIYDLIWKSGIQILIFIAGLQTIPGSLFEVSKIEGATSWENFCFVTLPLLTPMVLLNVIYTVIDVFTDYENVIMSTVYSEIRQLRYENASAMALLYFVCVALILSIVTLLGSRKTVYIVD
jgi:ABC-type sugar transport system permease subunit